MKKIFYLASIAALAFSSCAKDETTEAQIGAVNGGTKITAAVEADDTRTSLEKVDGKYEFRWSAGDQLGVYGVGENTLNNAAFVLENASDGKAVGVFASQNVELKADKQYVAVYPRFQTSLFSTIGMTGKIHVPGTKEDTADYVDLEDVKVTIPATQKYQNGTFYTGTVPAVSTEFFVNEDGGANLSMQPVVDYLFVNITSTEPIKTLTLALNNGNDNLNIAGTAALTRYELGDSHRYLVQHNDMSDKHITLETDESYATVTCHKPNTYVFAVPGGIFGTGYNVRAYLYVNKTTFGDNWDFAVADYKVDGKQMVDNTHLNWGDAKKTVKRLDKNGNAVVRLENTVFWANPISVDTDGDKKADARGSFVYNPNGDVIISNEVELLRYINQYNIQNTKLDEDDYYAPEGMEADEVQYYGKDAFLCEDGSFDFSLKNMMELATEYKNTEFEPYIAAYLADVEKGGGFPCFVKYENNFIGNGAVIENIEQPLLSWSGIFGGKDYTTYKVTDIIPVGATRGGEFVETKDGEASITNVTFSNIVAKSDVYYDDDYALSHGMILEETCRGHVLAGSFDGTIKNVTVKNADGESIMGDMSVAQYNGLNIEGVSKLDNIAYNLNAEASLDFTKTWDVVAGVKENVFHKVIPSKNAKGENALHVITIPEGDADEYAKLTWYVYPGSGSAVAVVIDGVSYWTGDSFEPSKAIKNAAGAVVGYQARYAEELAGANRKAIELTRDIDLNYSNLQWDTDYDGYADVDIKWQMLPLQSLNGAKHSISNVVMEAAYAQIMSLQAAVAMPWDIAPFDVPVVKDITLNNVYINVATPASEANGVFVPTNIAGLTVGGEDANGQTVITNVTINDLEIDAYRHDGTNNTEANYSDEYVSRIGWAVACAQNAQITNVKVNGVKSTVKGIAGLVAQNNINSSSKFVNAEVANVEAVNAAITKFAEFNSAKMNYNVMGTAVGLVKNEADRKVDIKFMQCGEPVFLYDADSALTVIYNETEKGSFKNK